MGTDDEQSFGELAKGFGEASPEAKAAEEDIARREKFGQMIDRLNEEGLGRAIGINKPIAGSSSEFDQEIVGYVLPLNNEDTSHLVVFKTGDMLAGVASDPHNEGRLKNYKNTLGANLVPYDGIGGGTIWKTIDDAVNSFRKGIIPGGLKVIHANSNLDQLSELDEDFDKALNVSMARKAEKIQAQRSSMDSLMKRLNATIFKPEGTAPNPDQPQPPLQPPTIGEPPADPQPPTQP